MVQEQGRSHVGDICGDGQADHSTCRDLLIELRPDYTVGRIAIFAVHLGTNKTVIIK